MKKRILYDEEFYSKLLKEETINISKNFNTSEFWGDKVNEGVLIAYDFIPSNKKLKLLEMNTNIGIFKEYIPYFDFNGFSSFCKKNKYKKVIGVVNKHWYNRGYGTRSSTPSRDFMSLLESMLHKCGVKFELFSAPKYPESIPEIDTDKNTFILRFSFDPDSKIDSLAADKNLFREHIEKYGLSSLLPSTGNNLLEKKYKNKSFPDVVLKNPKLDRRLGIEFRKLPYNLENENENFVEKFIISDKIEGLDEYNLEIRGMALVTNNNVIVLNTEPFMDAKRYILNKDNSLQQINAHGTSFIEDTMIELASGRKKKIQYVKSGDKVISYDIKDLDKNKSWRDWIKMNWDGLDTLKTVYADVGGSIRKKTLGYVLINNKFKVTKNAALCVSDKSLKWKFKSALDVIVGDTVLLSGNEFVEVVSKEISDDIVNSYGIDIHNYDNYFGDRLLAHNIGVGAWCFIAGTKISMSDGTEKNIEDVRIGDTVMSWDENDNKIKSSIVCRLKQPIHNDMVNIKFGNEIKNVNTFDHPYYVKNKGWSSYRPDLTMNRYKIGEIKQIEVGDICYYNNDGGLEEIKISFIKEELGKVKTYIVEIENYNTFFANGILTHNKDGSTTYSYITAGRQSCFMPDQLINMSDGTYKKISDVVIGDEVNTYNIKTTEIESSMVNEIMTKLHDDVYELHLANGKILKPTGNHPFLTKNKDWTTIDGHDPNHAGGSEYLEVGNYVKDIKDGWVRVNKIVGIEGEHLTYNFIDMKNGTIIADDIVTHNSSRRNYISYFNVQTKSPSGADKGDDVATRQYVSAAGTPSYIWNMGGYPSPKNWISYFGVDTTSGNATDRGDLYNGSQGGCGTTEMPDTENKYSGAPYVYYSGGQNGGKRNIIQYFSGITTSGNSSDVGDLTQSKSFAMGMSGISYNFHCGGTTSCFLPNQLINMSDETYKKISDIELCDKILVWDEANKKVVKNIVNEIHIKLHDDVYELHLANGKILKPTGNHPFLIKDKKWATIDGYKPNHAGGDGVLLVGDCVYDIKDGWIEVINIISITGKHATYNFIDMKNGTIIADDIVTHNSSRRNYISYFDVQTKYQSGTDKGDDIVTRQYPASAGTPFFIWNFGGYPSPKNWIAYFNVDTTSGNASDRGDLYNGCQGGSGTSEMPDTNNKYGGEPYVYLSGGQNGGRRNVIQYFDGTTTSGNSSDKGDLTNSKTFGMGMCGITYSFHCGGHTTCFLPNQLINMSDGTYKKISDVVIGDEVNTYNIKTTEIESSMVNKIMTKLHDDVYELHLANRKILKPTGNHPFLTKNKDWTTIDGHDPNHAGGSGYLEVGNYVKDIKDGWVRVNKIVGIEGEHLTYNFIDMKNGTIIADDIVTHNSVINVIERFSNSSTSGNAVDSGDLTAVTKNSGTSNGAGYDSGEIGNIAGGTPTNAAGNIDRIQYLDLSSSTGNTVDKGTLTSTRAFGGVTSGDGFFFYSCGHNGSTSINNLEFWEITTSVSNAADTGDNNVVIHGHGTAAGFSGTGAE